MHASFIRDPTSPFKTWLSHQRHDLFLRDMTHSRVTLLNHTWYDSVMCDVPHSYVTWPMHMCLDAFSYSHLTPQQQQVTNPWATRSHHTTPQYMTRLIQMRMPWRILVKHTSKLPRNMYPWALTPWTCEVTCWGTTQSQVSAMTWEMSPSSGIWLIYERHDSFIRDMTHWSATWLIH